MIDSGGPGMIVLAAPFVERHGLIAAARELTPNLVEHPGVGVGGTNRRLVGRLPFLEIGPYRLERPIAGFSQAASGAYARTDIAGTIGGSTLKRFTVIYDYRRQRVILEPNGHYTDLPEQYDMSGLLLRARGKELREFFVYKVMANSPASEAGMEAGDVLVAIDGKALDCELSQIGPMLKAAGARRTVVIVRNGQRRVFQLTLRTLL
jgi:membrane-associated protease RseP (regulator of RpoE activity)